ncbi:hypothetical protein FHT86_007301 [Rhizobium sp. BK313]|uniref:hypothetical protein n=1 Tax=Rhizobium sp. BK313 TaxID=2587081 RepID=UPI00105BD68E|nr:hypothetical protein [Rhizobium sp. BK313]MBB3458972.1 hypothetical protein [Rhizobium sp. BK313]
MPDFVRVLIETGVVVSFEEFGKLLLDLHRGKTRVFAVPTTTGGILSIVKENAEDGIAPTGRLQ